MRGTLAIGISVAASAAVAASAPLGPVAIPLDQDVAAARAEAAAAIANQRRLEAAAAKAQDQAQRLTLERQAAAQAIEVAEAQATAADAQLHSLDSKLAQQRLQLARQQAPAQSLVGALALMSRRSPLLLVADSRSPEELVKVQLLLDSALPAIRARTTALSAAVRRGEELRQSQLRAKGAAAQARQVLAQRAADLDALEKRADRLAQMRGGEALGAADIALSRQEQTSEAERVARSGRSAIAVAAELAREGPALTVPSLSRATGSDFDLRYRLPARAPLVEGFGEIDENGIRSRAVTLQTVRGAAVFAPSDGVVLFAGPFRSFDGVVIIDHGHGWRSVLINVASNLARGIHVRGGAPIGTATGAIEVQLLDHGTPVSPALIAGSSAMLSNPQKGG
jgi:septal ring factor EnvC (AmiA/AmiB activator)